MKGQAPERSPPDASFSWPRATWTVLLAALMYGLYCLHDYRILNEEQIMLLVFIAVPVAAFVLSGRGQVRAERGNDGWTEKNGGGGQGSRR